MLFQSHPWALAGLTLGYLQLREGWMRWVVPQLRGWQRGSIEGSAS